jgi:hypothetical protein
MAIARALLDIPAKEKCMSEIVSPSQEEYRKLLADTMFQGRTRILSFWDHPSSSISSFPDLPSSTLVKPTRNIRCIPQVLSFIIRHT